MADEIRVLLKQNYRSDFPRQIEGTWQYIGSTWQQTVKPGNQIVQNKLSTPSQSTGAELGNLTQIDTGLKRTDITNTRRL